MRKLPFIILTGFGLILLFVFLTGCAVKTTMLNSPDESVPSELVGEDCIHTFFGFALGENSFDVAKANGAILKPNGWPIPETIQPIVRVRSVELEDLNVLGGGFGSRCVKVRGVGAE